MTPKTRVKGIITSENLRFIEPQLLTPASEPPEGDEWEHELKYDGYRTQIVIGGGGARAYTRNGFDWSDPYPAVVTAADNLNCPGTIIDRRSAEHTSAFPSIMH